LEDVPNRHAPRHSNDAAEELIVAAQPLGLNFDNSRSSATKPWKPWETEEHKAIGSAVELGLFEWLEGESPASVPVETQVRSYLVAHSSDLESVKQLLLRDQVPEWELDLDRLHDLLLPPLLPHLALVRLLVTDALMASLEGDDAKAAKDLEAAWRLAQGLKTRPELISQLIRLKELRIIAGGIRHVGLADRVWSDRFWSLSVTRSVAESLAGEAWVNLEWARRGTPGLWKEGALGRLVGVLSQPYTMYCMLDYADTMATVVQSLSATEPCGLDRETAEKIWSPSFPDWDKISPRVWPDLNGIWNRATKTDLDGELTSLVVLSRSTSPCGQPSSDSCSVPSLVCPGSSWVASRRRGASWHIEVSREPAWLGHVVTGRQLELPLRFTTHQPGLPSGGPQLGGNVRFRGPGSSH
jgi:hypothetical protein